LEQTKAELEKMFEGLTISVSGLHKHMTTKCALSLEDTKPYTIERDATGTLNLRFDIIVEWKAAGVDFQKNCAFMDEAGFNSHQIRGRG
jgi:hypothetical protein